MGSHRKIKHAGLGISSHKNKGVSSHKAKAGKVRKVSLKMKK